MLLNGKETSPNEKGTSPNEKETSLNEKETIPNGKETRPNGKETSLVEDASTRTTGAVASEISGDQIGSASCKRR